MAQVIQGGRDAFDAWVFRGTENTVRTHWESRNQQLMDAIPETYVGLKSFYEEAQQTFNTFAEIDYKGIYEAMSRLSDTLFDDNVSVKLLKTVEEFQTSSGLTRQLLMADPYIRKMAQQQRIEGFSDVYNDPFASFKTEDHPDYIRMHNSIVTEDEDGNFEATTTFFDDFGYDLEELELPTQVMAIQNGRMARMLMEEFERDVTSPSDASLG